MNSDCSHSSPGAEGAADSDVGPRRSALSVEESRNDCNGHSSPDSGVNDMSDDRPSTASSNGDSQQHVSEERRQHDAQHESKITLVVDEQLTIRLGDTVRHITGPAHIAMVANSGATGPMPSIQAPHGHIVQRIYDDNLPRTHLVLRQQHPSVTNMSNQGPGSAQMGHNGGYASYHSGSQQMPLSSGPHHQHYNYGSGGQQGPYPSSQQPYPPGYHPQYHHHLMQGGGSLHPMVHNGGGGPNTNNNNHGPEDRIQIQRTGGRHRDKTSIHHQRHKNPAADSIIMQHQQPCFTPNIVVNPRINLNGLSPRGGQRSLDMNSCSSSTDSHDTTSEDEKRLLFDILSSIQPPEVEVESRRAVVHITSPNIPETMIPLDQPINTDVHFQLQYSDAKDGPPYNVVYEGDATTIKMEDLKPATKYFIRVNAILDDITGNFTEPVPFETNPAAPDAPLAPKLCQKSKAFISLKWNAAVDNGSKILHYILEYYKGQQHHHHHHHPDFTECFSGSKKEFKLTKLQPSQRYTFRLSAVNGCGRSEYSKETVIYTNGTAPPQPDAPHLSQATLNSLLLTWFKRPGVDKEFVLQKEEEHTGHGFLAAYTGPEVSYKVDCLRKSTTYKFRLLASNDDGKSEWSRVVTYRTKADLPDAPTKLSVKGKVYSSSFRLVWEPPREDGGCEVRSYLTQLDSGNGYQAIYDGSVCECSCANLLPGFTYRARVAARNSVGVGRWSEPTHITTRAVTPGQCDKPGLHGKPKAHSLHLKWARPEQTGGSPIKAYVTQLIKMDNTMTEVYRGYSTDCVVAGLSPGRSYLLQVKAVNDAGEGEWSEPLEVISGAGIPEPPLQPTCRVKSAHTVLVSWKAPCNNGAKISEYRLECLKPHQQEYSLSFAGADLEHEVKSLLPNSEYSFRVQAVNSSGASPHSPPSSATTLPSSPAAVHHVRATPSATSISVSWTEPDDHGSEIIHYNVEYGKNQLQTVSTETEFDIEDVTPDTVYRIRVQAVNCVGAGVYSSQVKVTTLSLPPSPPCLECVASTWNSVRLRWTEIDKCDEYSVWMSRGESTLSQCVYQGSLLQCRMAKLHEQTDYHFTISAHNSAGEGPLSAPLTVRTSRAPPHSLKAPVIGESGEKFCEVSWQAAKPFPGDDIEYRLQLSEQHAASSPLDYKQVHQSGTTAHRLKSLKPGGSYSLRVCPVRICRTSGESVLGAYSPGVSFKTPKPLPVSAPEKASHAPAQPSVLKVGLQRVINAVKPEKDNQTALMMLLALFAISGFVAVLAHYYVDIDTASES